MSPSGQTWVFPIAAAAVLLAASAQCAVADGDLKAGEQAPPVQASGWLNVKSDETPTPERLRGKVVMIEFWGTWCNPCIQSMPHVQDVWNRYKDRGLVLVAISYESVDVIRAFVEKNGYTMPFGSDPEKACIGAYAVKSWPHTVVIDREGKLAFVGNPYGVEPAIEKALGLEASPGTLLTQYLGSLSDATKGRPSLERLVEKASGEFDLRQWAKAAGGTSGKAALPLDAVKALSDYAKLCAAPKADAAKKQAALDALAAAAPEKFDLASWARESFGRDFPLTTKELAKLLEDKQFDLVVDALLDRNPSPEAVGTAAKCIPLAVHCAQHTTDARTTAKKGLMAHLWVFAKKPLPSEEKNKAFWGEINVTAWQETPDKQLAALQIGGRMVTESGAPAFVDRQLARWFVMDALKEGKKPVLNRLRDETAKQRETLTRDLKARYEK